LKDRVEVIPGGVGCQGLTRRNWAINRQRDSALLFDVGWMAGLEGGKLNKARRGELRTPLPAGLLYDSASRIVLDPDREVQAAIRCIFHTFQVRGGTGPGGGAGAVLPLLQRGTGAPVAGLPDAGGGLWGAGDVGREPRAAG
jgi:hypothetical protein